MNVQINAELITFIFSNKVANENYKSMSQKLIKEPKKNKIKKKQLIDFYLLLSVEKQKFYVETIKLKGNINEILNTKVTVQKKISKKYIMTIERLLK